LRTESGREADRLRTTAVKLDQIALKILRGMEVW
jgi:hypothetical protein